MAYHQPPGAGLPQQSSQNNNPGAMKRSLDGPDSANNNLLPNKRQNTSRTPVSRPLNKVSPNSPAVYNVTGHYKVGDREDVIDTTGYEISIFHYTTSQPHQLYARFNLGHLQGLMKLCPQPGHQQNIFLRDFENACHLTDKDIPGAIDPATDSQRWLMRWRAREMGMGLGKRIGGELDVNLIFDIIKQPEPEMSGKNPIRLVWAMLYNNTLFKFAAVKVRELEPNHSDVWFTKTHREHFEGEWKTLYDPAWAITPPLKPHTPGNAKEVAAQNGLPASASGQRRNQVELQVHADLHKRSNQGDWAPGIQQGATELQQTLSRKPKLAPGQLPTLRSEQRVLAPSSNQRLSAQFTRLPQQVSVPPSNQQQPSTQFLQSQKQLQGPWQPQPQPQQPLQPTSQYERELPQQSFRSPYERAVPQQPFRSPYETAVPQQSMTALSNQSETLLQSHQATDQNRSSPALDNKPRPSCLRCKKHKKRCDRQRPCQRCEFSGLSADQCEDGAPSLRRSARESLQILSAQGEVIGEARPVQQGWMGGDSADDSDVDDFHSGLPAQRPYKSPYPNIPRSDSYQSSSGMSAPTQKQTANVDSPQLSSLQKTPASLPPTQSKIATPPTLISVPGKLPGTAYWKVKSPPREAPVSMPGKMPGTSRWKANVAPVARMQPEGIEISSGSEEDIPARREPVPKKTSVGNSFNPINNHSGHRNLMPKAKMTEKPSTVDKRVPPQPLNSPSPSTQLQAELATPEQRPPTSSALNEPASSQPGTDPVLGKRKRGRPRGSLNKKKIEVEAGSSPAINTPMSAPAATPGTPASAATGTDGTPKRGRGRPRKNKEVPGNFLKRKLAIKKEEGADGGDNTNSQDKSEPTNGKDPECNPQENSETTNANAYDDYGDIDIDAEMEKFWDN